MRAVRRLPSGAHLATCLFVLCRSSQPSVSYKTNAVKTTAKGYRVIDFADGGRVEIHFPAYYLKGERQGGAHATPGGGVQECWCLCAR